MVAYQYLGSKSGVQVVSQRHLSVGYPNTFIPKNSHAQDMHLLAFSIHPNVTELTRNHRLDVGLNCPL